MSPDPARILIADSLDESARAIFARHGLAFIERPGLDQAALCALLRETPSLEAIVVRSATRITRAVLEAAPSLRVVGRAGVGVDNVDCDAATELGVVVMNAPEGNTTTTAELAIALMLALARNVATAAARTRAGQWSKKGLLGTELTGKTLGVVGLGRIGRVVAARGLGLAMDVIAHDPFLDLSEPAPVRGVELVELDDLLARADVVTLHVPLTDATRNLLSRERLAAMKPGARLVNAARGGLVDEAALCDALAAGRLAGAALDVLAEEPPAPDHPLLGRDDVIVTPHLGASSHEAQANVAYDIATQVADFLERGIPRNAVNAPQVDAATFAELAPYVRLAEKMGRFLAHQAASETLGRPLQVELVLAGAIASKDASHVRLALCCGALAALGVEGVNFVNAPRLAQARGLHILEERADDAGSWTSLIKARVANSSSDLPTAVWGTVFGREPRFVRLDGVWVDLAPQGPLLVTRHADEPGVVGRIGTRLGELGLNIRRIELGPPHPGSEDAARTESGLATGFFTLDGDPAPEVVEAIAELPGMRSVRLVRL